MAVGGNGLGDAFQRVAQRAQMQVAVDPAELLASLDPARGAPAAHVGQEHTASSSRGCGLEATLRRVGCRPVDPLREQDHPGAS
jgi:hypothetical protein